MNEVNNTWIHNRCFEGFSFVKNKENQKEMCESKFIADFIYYIWYTLQVVSKVVLSRLLHEVI